ncbi:MAG: 23S rRNA (adenine(2503)-C(2))-methyltransferase RlmN [Gammaproteobacteria bacterium]|nr:23S rRNA (adenine(2503)-C(2))-methyltransferase RlmN [Gammaproteobacteria bacterium]
MATAEKTNLMDLDRKGMEQFVQSLGHKPFHGRNLIKWIHKHGVTEFDAMTDLSLRLRETLKQQAEIRVPQVVTDQAASDGTHKAVLEVDSHNRIECVHIPEENRNTLCISSQVGCALECSFCSTARQGFNRNLTTGEIIGQLWTIIRGLGKPVSNVVMMGMGEPLANLDNVVSAMDIMQDTLCYSLSKHKITISTSGIVPALRRLDEMSDISLAVSLHAPTNELRDQLVPINKKYPLEQLIPACKDFIEGDKRRKVTWEYVMLDGVNDSDQHARQLIRLLAGVPSKMNLIPFNPFPGSGYRSSSPERIERFRMILMKAGIFSMTRKTRGDDIDAACGQLVGKVKDKSRRAVPVAAPNPWTERRL